MRRLGIPWVIGGDFNLSPDKLRESGFLSAVWGEVVATPSATCGASALDYFVVVRLVGRVGLEPTTERL